MKVVLGALVLVAMSGCASGRTAGTATPKPERTASASPSVPDAQQRWDRAGKQLRKLATGHFSATTTDHTVSNPAQRQDGFFDLHSGSMDVELEVRTGSGGLEVTRARVTPDGKGYLAMPSWRGTWSNCWLPMKTSALQDRSAGSERMPLPVAVLLRAEVVDPRATTEKIGARVDAFSALRLQGSSAADLRDVESRLHEVEVPVTLSVTDDPVTVTAELQGTDIVEAVHRAGTQLDGRAVTQIRRLSTEVEITEVGEPVNISPPESDAVLPTGATKQDTCAASGR